MNRIKPKENEKIILKAIKGEHTENINYKRIMTLKTFDSFKKALRIPVGTTVGFTWLELDYLCNGLTLFALKTVCLVFAINFFLRHKNLVISSIYTDHPKIISEKMYILTTLMFYCPNVIKEKFNRNDQESYYVMIKKILEELVRMQ